ncbi:hypothetical protein [Nocardia pseudovaccinii]|uniref:hypothetical protein n=1 Tax=Nocardia pseudovaccinii TaxID=189540 RepID=UPI0007A49C72|nr:hypothetical protein [Nocardia pseudovaccinii]
MADSVPSIGRIVHYQSYGTPGGEHPSEPLAAIVTSVDDRGRVGLAVFYDNGISHKADVPYSWADEPEPGHWSWPPRV